MCSGVAILYKYSYLKVIAAQRNKKKERNMQGYRARGVSILCSTVTAHALRLNTGGAMHHTFEACYPPMHGHQW